ncbi:uncharacterized protein LOC127245875 isoform X2 [Andrographis paniculata]|uniref:uncharacterized protein LOC127245875 isoform X2 n=1 Tax=Andrographis paniculata TaxID=175694 RepID=UPI0021E6DD11|nr:uncharacterized protein LOC127245875 isoform X2 [Andrographis paniculata]
MDVKFLRNLPKGVDYPFPPFQDHRRFSKYGFNKFRYGAGLISRTNPSLEIPFFHHQHSRPRPARILSAERNYEPSHQSSRKEPFWLNPFREALWNTRSLLVFLAEQPGQLKYIEWPSFRSTLRTALLTLVIVALLIVALSSVDSALSYLLALFLRRKA